MEQNLEWHSDRNGGFYTNSDFWDCECDANYIHPRSEKECSVCGSHESDQPDSRRDEIPLRLLMAEQEATA